MLVTFQSKDLELDYDQIKNQTTASSNELSVKLKDNFITKNFDLKIQCVFQGQRPNDRPEKAYLVFRALSHRWRFLEESERQGSLLIDGQRLDLSPKPNYTSVIGEKFLDETLVYEVQIADVQRIARASNIGFQIGKVEGNFKGTQVAKIKKFLKELTSL
jgi:hypothetical protein